MIYKSNLVKLKYFTNYFKIIINSQASLILWCKIHFGLGKIRNGGRERVSWNVCPNQCHHGILKNLTSGANNF